VGGILVLFLGEEKKKRADWLGVYANGSAHTSHSFDAMHVAQ
jgi:hypothetical protein